MASIGALLGLYEDAACMQPLATTGPTAYDLLLGPLTGLDGDTGDQAICHLYIKNTGDKGAINVCAVKTSDILNQVALSSDGVDYIPNDLEITDIDPGAVRDIFIRIIVPNGSRSSIYNPTFVINYDSPV